MSAAEELVYAAAFALAFSRGLSGAASAVEAQRVVQALRETSSGSPAGRSAWQRMLHDFKRIAE